MGGSGGGSGTYATAGAGAGGGAILIASSGDIHLLNGEASGSIRAMGGSYTSTGYTQYPGGGSGGAIRLMSNLLSGPGTLRARGGAARGAKGRIRLEAYEINVTDGGDPAWTAGVPSSIFPPADSPTLAAKYVANTEVTGDPLAGIHTTDLELTVNGPATIEIEATNIPVLDPPVTVEVRIVPARGDVITVTSSGLVDDDGNGNLDGILHATADVTLPSGRSEIQLRANWTP